MPTKTQSLFDRAAEKVLDQFGERDEQGEFSKVQLKIGEQEYPLTAIIHEENYQVALDERGDVYKSVGRSIDVLLSEMASHEITSLPETCHVMIGDTEWPHDPQQTQWGETFVTIGLRMDILQRTRTQERRNG